MKKFDVIVVGELNVDLILNRMDSFPELGKEIIAKDLNITLGSSSAIFASNLSSLGARVGFIGRLGKDEFGDLVLKNLKASGVDTSMILQNESDCTGATIVLNYGEDRAMLTHRGAMEQLSFQDIHSEMLCQGKHLHFSSYFLQPGIQKDLEKLFTLAKKEGMTTSFDAQWDPSEKWDLNLETLLPHVDVFLPNEKELLKLTGAEHLEEAIHSLQGSENITVIKMGNKGSISLHQNKVLHLPPFLNKNAVDAIGAGDSFNAGFVSKYIKGAPLEKCQEFGNLMGAISTTASGGTGAFKIPGKIKETARKKFGYNQDEFTD